ncbi:MAG TPA: hypothetical protein VK614_08270 [Allosphingosinicella sp.]|nr:hypothetical protein [Allosphingosinicella sp.]
MASKSTKADTSFKALPSPASCKLVDFDGCKVIKLFAHPPYVLLVWGTRHSSNVEVSLRPLIYVTKPDYWGIEVVGCQSGIGLPVEIPYVEVMMLMTTIGKKGVEIIGANQKVKIPI